MASNQDTILEGFERHLKILKGLATSSVKAYRRHVEEFLAWREGNAHDGLVTREDIEGYLQWCFYRGNSNVTRVTKIAALQSYFRYLVYNGTLTEDPTALLLKPRTTRPFIQTFNRDEILRMFAVCDISTAKGLRDAVFLILGAFAGFRVSEITNFNIEQIQDDGKEINLAIPKTKHGAGRSVYLWKAPGLLVRQLLAARLQEGAITGDPLLVSFYKGGRPRGNERLYTKSANMLLKTLAKRAKIRKPSIKVHLLRSCHASDLQAVKGYTMPAIMERMGWKNLETAARYLVRRERINKEYSSLHAYWRDFSGVWENNDSPSAGINL